MLPLPLEHKLMLQSKKQQGAMSAGCQLPRELRKGGLVLVDSRRVRWGDVKGSCSGCTRVGYNSPLGPARVWMAYEDLLLGRTRSSCLEQCKDFDTWFYLAPAPGLIPFLAVPQNYP